MPNGFPIADASAFNKTSDIVIHAENRRFLWWIVAQSHFLVKNAKIVFEQDCATIVPTEPLIEVLHPWLERLAFRVARLWS